MLLAVILMMCCKALLLRSTLVDIIHGISNGISMPICAETTRGSTQMPNVLLGAASFKRKAYKHVNIP